MRARDRTQMREDSAERDRHQDRDRDRLAAAILPPRRHRCDRRARTRGGVLRRDDGGLVVNRRRLAWLVGATAIRALAHGELLVRAGEQPIGRGVFRAASLVDPGEPQQAIRDHRFVEVRGTEARDIVGRLLRVELGPACFERRLELGANGCIHERRLAAAAEREQIEIAPAPRLLAAQRGPRVRGQRQRHERDRDQRGDEARRRRQRDERDKRRPRPEVRGRDTLHVEPDRQPHALGAHLAGHPERAGRDERHVIDVREAGLRVLAAAFIDPAVRSAPVDDDHRLRLTRRPRRDHRRTGGPRPSR